MKQVWPAEWSRWVDRAPSRRLGRIEPRRAATGWFFHPVLRDAQFSCGFIMPQKAWLLNSRKRLPGRRIEYGPFFATLSLTPLCPPTTEEQARVQVLLSRGRRQGTLS